MTDKRFNRISTDIDNHYLPFYGTKRDTSQSYKGLIKCKLVHSQNDSIVLPDQIFLMTSDVEFKWIQPLTCFFNLLIKDEDTVNCHLNIDISYGNTLLIEFSNKDWIVNFEDNSSLFNCTISGPINILDFVTGTGFFHDSKPYLNLFHHTLTSHKTSILKSKKLFASSWNIQGTKKLVNINYFYLSCLDKILKKSDLQQIGMASNGKIQLVLDNANLPPIIKPKESYLYQDSILEIEVYRENTYNRTATLAFKVDSTILSTKHVWKHLPDNDIAFYEFCLPFIFRIGALPGETITFNDLTISRNSNMIGIDYLIIGLGTDLKGLEAPFDEENTEYIFKIEKLDSVTNILDFWFENSNQDLFSDKNIQHQEFLK